MYWRQNRRNTREFRVEIARIRGAGNLRLEWWLDSLVVHVIPIDISEEWLAHNFLSVSGSASETLIGLSGKQLLKDRD